MTPHKDTQPAVSVVVVTLEGPRALRRCLAALSHQDGGLSVEVIVPWERRAGGPEQIEAEFPEVRILRLEGTRTYAELRAAGISDSRAAIVAITEDHCVPVSDWCAQIIASHRAPHAAIGGPVEKDVPDVALGWAWYLADYSRYMSPTPEGPAGALTDCNVSYKRAALEPIRTIWDREFHEPAVHAALVAAGESLWMSPHMIVRERRTLDYRDGLRDRYVFGRLFASLRVAGASRVRRVAYIAGTVALPALLVARIATRLALKRRHLAAFVRALPALLLATSVWSFGELVGYITGTPEHSLRVKPGT